MKRILISALATGLLAGCTTVNKSDACNAATTAYSVYLAVINAKGNPSHDQIIAAQAAAAVLTAQCGWSTPGAIAVRDMMLPPPNDRNGVPILLPPK